MKKFFILILIHMNLFACQPNLELTDNDYTDIAKSIWRCEINVQKDIGNEIFLETIENISKVLTDINIGKIQGGLDNDLTIHLRANIFKFINNFCLFIVLFFLKKRMLEPDMCEPDEVKLLETNKMHSIKLKVVKKLCEKYIECINFEN